MSTTTYEVSKQTIEGDFVVVATKGKKQAAIDLATKVRADERVATRVESSGGKLVFEAKARKPQVRTKPYTRVVALPEGYEAPAGKRVAYVRSGVGRAVLHDAEQGLYSVWNYVADEVDATFGTTRQCGRYLADEVEAPA